MRNAMRISRLSAPRGEARDNRIRTRIIILAVVVATVELSGCGGGGDQPIPTYTVGGSVTGLAGSGLVLRNSDGSEMAIASNGSFVLSSKLAGGSAYAVTTKTQPTDPIQTCLIENATGAVAGANVSNVAVKCTTRGRFAYISSHMGIYCSAVDTTTGALTTLAGSPCDSGVLTGVSADPSGKFAYSTLSLTDQVRAYTIDASTGSLTAIADQSGGAASGPSGPPNPVDITVDPSGHFVYMANYSGSISAFMIDAATGDLTAVSGSPFLTAPAAIAGQVAGANSVTVDPSSRYLYAAINQGNDISAYAIDSNTGELTPIAGSPFPAGKVPMTVRVDPSGRFVYVANAYSNDISAYVIDPVGALTPIAGSPFASGGTFTSGLAIDLSGKFVYATNTNSNTVSAFSIDSSTGALSPIAGSPFPAGAGPISAVVHPSGMYVYVGDNGSGYVSGYAIDSNTGILTPIAGSPFAASGNGSSGTYCVAFGD